MQHVQRVAVEVLVPLEIWGYQEPMGPLVHQVTLERMEGEEKMDMYPGPPGFPGPAGPPVH